jgi:hypothetical protein
MPKRFLLLTGTAAVLAVILIGKWIADWGLVTIHVKNAPLRTVIASIARQGHVHVESSLDPLRPITMDIDHATPAEAVDLLATRADASWRAVIVAAPAKAPIEEAKSSLRSGGSPDGWVTSYYPLPGPMLVASGDSAIDPRQLDWKPEGPDLDLLKLLDEAAQKSGVMTLVPATWAPAVSKLPKADAAGKALHALIVSVRGQDESFLYLTEPRRQQGATPDPEITEAAAAWGGRRGSAPGADRPSMKPEWADQRARARIKKLPAAVQAESTKEYEETKAVFDGMKDLPPEARREKIREIMANPSLQEKMADARLRRDSKMTAEQRISRAVNYISRKAAAKAANK